MRLWISGVLTVRELQAMLDHMLESGAADAESLVLVGRRGLTGGHARDGRVVLRATRIRRFRVG